MAQQIHEGTPRQLAPLLKRHPKSRFRLIELESGDDQETELLPLPDPQNAASIALLKLWLQEDARDDPEEIRQAETELQEFKRNMNRPRKEAAARLLYPEVE